MGKQETEEKGAETQTPKQPQKRAGNFKAKGAPVGILGNSQLADAIIKRNTEEISGRRRSPTQSTDRGGKCRSNHGHGHV